jgi:hypothetical protein
MNCVEFEELLASEAQSGLKIPSGQIAGGKFTIAPDGQVGLRYEPAATPF